MSYSLQNKIILITGASSGIGHACAIACANAGAKLIVTARRLEKLKALAESVDTDVYPVQCDIRDKNAIQTFINELPPEWQNIDILINNAGLAAGFGPLHEGKDDDFDLMIDTNVKGLLYITRNVVSGMVKRNKGHVINIGSIAGHEAYANGTVYCATKFAVNAINTALKKDLLGTNIRVSSIDPGMVKTNFSEVRFKGDKARAEQVYAGMQALTPEDIADAVLYCATRPQHVNVSDMIVLATAQVSATVTHREN